MSSILILSNKIDVREITKSIILCSAITGAIALIQIVVVALNTNDLFNYLNSIKATMANKNLLSSFLYLTFPFLLSAKTINKSWHRFAISTFISELFIILLIQTKAVWIAIILFTVVIFFYSVKKSNLYSRTTLYLILSILIIGSIYSLMYFNFSVTNKIFVSAFNFNTANTRFLLNENSIEMIKNHYFLGVGTNNWQIWFPHYGLNKFSADVSNGISTFQRPHNDFLWVFCESGILGFTFFLSIFITCIYYCIRLIKSSMDDAERQRYVVYLATVVGYAVISFLDFPLERIEHNIIFFTLLAIVASENEIRNRRSEVRNQRSEISDFSLPTSDLRSRGAGVRTRTSLLLLSIFTFIVGCYRLNGEFHTHKLIAAHWKSDWLKMISEKKNAENIFYDMDSYSAPLSWYSGVAQFNLGNLSNAIADFEHAYEMHPFNIHVINNLASSYEKSNRHTEAIEYYKKALNISGDFRESLLNLSGAYYNNGEYENAFQTIIKCGIDTLDTKYVTFLKAILEKKNINYEKFLSSTKH